MTHFTKEREEWLLEYARQHKDDYPRHLYAKNAGVCIGKWYSLLRKVGGEIKHSPLAKKDRIELIKSCVETMTYDEIHEKYGISKAIIINTVCSHHLERGEVALQKELEHKRKVARENAKHIDKMKAGAAIAKLRRREELRVKYGMPQKTRLQLRTLSKRTYMAKNKLIYNHGYIRTTDPYLLWYDNKTKRQWRRLRNEEYENYYKKKYGLRFAKDPEAEVV